MLINKATIMDKRMNARGAPSLNMASKSMLMRVKSNAIGESITGGKNMMLVGID